MVVVPDRLSNVVPHREEQNHADESKYRSHDHDDRGQRDCAGTLYAGQVRHEPSLM
jgi:hypothetical protein